METNHAPQSDKPYHLYLSREQFNQLIETIELMLAVDADNEVTRDAAKMRDTFMRFAKKQKKDGDDRAAVILYEKEACPLIKLLLFYISAFRKTEPHDYFSEIRKNMRGKKNDSNEASQP